MVCCLNGNIISYIGGGMLIGACAEAHRRYQNEIDFLECKRIAGLSGKGLYGFLQGGGRGCVLTSGD